MIVDSTAEKIIIVRTGDAAFVAFFAKCTHKGAIIEYDPADKRFTCPKHGSSFDGATGKVIDGPADQSLPSYPVSGTAASVKVSSVSKKLSPTANIIQARVIALICDSAGFILGI